MRAMCGRFAQPRSADDLAQLYAATAVGRLPGEQYNVAPTDEVSAVLQPHEERLVDTFRWGLVPVWATSPREGARMINARAENVTTSSAFRGALRTRRCIVPADAFYEWRRDGPPGPRGGRPKPEPWAIQRRDGTPLAFAGLWSVWRDPETAARLYTCTVITTTPNEVVAPFHHRMPVILEPPTWDAWLLQETPLPALEPLLAPCDPTLIEAYPVDAAVNDVRSEGPQLLTPKDR
jgi:putative SOS response-associated peptidase YedK